MLGHAPEFGGHDAETAGHAPPKYALGTTRNEQSTHFHDRIVDYLASVTQRSDSAWSSAEPGSAQVVIDGEARRRALSLWIGLWGGLGEGLPLVQPGHIAQLVFRARTLHCTLLVKALYESCYYNHALGFELLRKGRARPSRTRVLDVKRTLILLGAQPELLVLVDRAERFGPGDGTQERL